MTTDEMRTITFSVEVDKAYWDWDLVHYALLSRCADVGMVYDSDVAINVLNAVEDGVAS